MGDVNNIHTRPTKMGGIFFFFEGEGENENLGFCVCVCVPFLPSFLSISGTHSISESRIEHPDVYALVWI